MDFPTEPGYYMCMAMAVMHSHRDDPNPQPAILEVSGIAPYLKAFLFYRNEVQEVSPNRMGMLASIGSRIDDAVNPPHVNSD